MQGTNNILLVRPAQFSYNKETADSNTFQRQTDQRAGELRENAFREFDVFAETLREKGVNVTVIEDTAFPHKPDAVFPNNWITFHPDGTVILYPMFAPNRRLERRADIVDALKEKFEVRQVIDLSHYEKENKFLEGTGSIVFDHVNKVAFACLSPRTDNELFIKVCRMLQYRPVPFHAYDRAGQEIYHTNVMMCVGTKFAVICLDSITRTEEREMVTQELKHGGHTIVDVSFAQTANFAGNMLSLTGKKGKNLLVMSQSAFNSLSPEQKQTLELRCELVPLSIKTIETIGGGSARCMIAEIYLPLKSAKR
jgi:hypothetical protein